MNSKFMFALSKALSVLAILLVSLACNSQVEVVEVVVTATPEVAAASAPLSSNSANTSSLAVHARHPTTAPIPTATRRPTAVPTAIPRPTATATPRPTRRATATPRPTPTPTPRLRTSATQTKQFTVESGSSYHYTIRNSDVGFINYQFNSVKDVDPSEPLDIDFGIREERGTLFRANDVTSFIGSISAEKGKDYLFLFDNTSSIFTGKTVTLSFNWSSEPSYPVSPYFGEHKNTTKCQQLASESQASGTPSIDIWLQIGMAAIGGDWITTALSLFSLFLTNSQADANGVTEADRAGYSMTLWGCGIQ